MNPETLWIESLPSPIGTLRILTDANGCVHGIDFDDYASTTDRRWLARHYGAALQLDTRKDRSEAAERIARYLAGDLAALDRIAVEARGTPFQRQVWVSLRSIPAGETISYGGLAARIGRPTASRAVGMANNANPVPIIVPCHRVIGTDGSLTGYGGGLDRKRWLLAHERRHAP